MNTDFFVFFFIRVYHVYPWLIILSYYQRKQHSLAPLSKDARVKVVGDFANIKKSRKSFCSFQYLIDNYFYMERVTGIEPARLGWCPIQTLKVCVLPLHYTRILFNFSAADLYAFFFFFLYPLLSATANTSLFILSSVI